MYAFEKAPGAILERRERTDAHWTRWGALVGSMHRLSAAYNAPPTWQEEYADIEALVADDPVYRQRLRSRLCVR